MVNPEELQRRLPRRHMSRIPRSRREAYKSFENLVVLAEDQERWKFAKNVGKQLVWRDVGEAPVLLERFRECAEHAGVGGLRECGWAILDCRRRWLKLYGQGLARSRMQQGLVSTSSSYALSSLGHQSTSSNTQLNASD